MCLDSPLEDTLNHVGNEIFSISDRTDDYMRLMDASIEVANVEENDDSEVVIDRYLQDTSIVNLPRDQIGLKIKHQR